MAQDENAKEALDFLKEMASTVRTVGTEIKLETGIVLKLKPVSEVTLRAAVQRFPKPEVPVEKFGDDEIEEPWPESPAYKSDMEVAMAKRNEALAHACQVIGTECLSVPDGYFEPGADGWVDQLRVIGVVLEPDQLSNPIDRYAAWLDHHAVMGFLDVNKITQSVLMKSAILEEEVWEAITFFRRDDLGEGTDAGESTVDSDTDGDRVRTSGARVRDRDGAARHGGGDDDTVGAVGSHVAGGEGQDDSVPTDKATREPAPAGGGRKRPKGKSRSG